jgi:hypothetical protein
LYNIEHNKSLTSYNARGDFMIGILCSEHMEKDCAEEFHRLLKEVGTKKDDDIIVFTISNIDFKRMTVIGSLVTREIINKIQTVVPRIIFNLSLQKDINGIKARKKLIEMKDVILINDSNKYDQWMIMDMLSSLKIAQKYLLPYHVYDKKKRDYKPDDNQAYIAMPARGASLSRIIHAVPDPSSDKITGSQYFKKGHICDYIDASLCQMYWIFIEVPELIVKYKHPVVIRSYLQRVSDRDWKVIGYANYPEYEFDKNIIYEKIVKASLTIVNYTNHFLPDLGISFVDFIVSRDGHPYFLHLGGFEKDFFDEQDNRELYRSFYKNIVTLTEYYKQRHREG